jgi:phospho-N-acetylmuramoyl-pentapeptide-transferase
VLQFAGLWLSQFFGPFRLLTSHLFLFGFGMLATALLTWWLLPKLAFILPRDRGRAFAIDSKAAEGKPTGAGFLFISILILIQALVMPLSWEMAGILSLTFGACVFGFMDDRAMLPWGEYKKGLIDLLIAFLASVLLSGLEPSPVWLPFTKVIWIVPVALFIPLSSILIWATINCTNCTDGVDGLSGTLLGLAFATISALLYFVLGHQEIAAYLLLPHYPDGAIWAGLSLCVVGALAGYLWHNAHPSALLMGDAGSRALGFLLGVFVIKTGNPFIIFIVSGVLLINGGTGLVKVALLRFFRISIFKDVRFPLHDHARKNRQWSNTQVLVRFTLIQTVITLVFIMLLLKVR